MHFLRLQTPPPTDWKIHFSPLNSCLQLDITVYQQVNQVSQRKFNFQKSLFICELHTYLGRNAAMCRLWKLKLIDP